MLERRHTSIGPPDRGSPAAPELGANPLGKVLIHRVLRLAVVGLPQCLPHPGPFGGFGAYLDPQPALDPYQVARITGDGASSEPSAAAKSANLLVKTRGLGFRVDFRPGFSLSTGSVLPGAQITQA